MQDFFKIEGETFSLHSELTNDGSLGEYGYAEFSPDGVWLVSCTAAGKLLIFRRNETTGEYDKIQELTTTE